MSILFAATYPERTRALVLCGAEVKEEKTDDWPWGESTREELRGVRWTSTRSSNAGARGSRHRYTSRRAEQDDDAASRQLRPPTGASPRSPHDAVAFMRMAFEIDVRDVVPAVKTPTLILHRVGDQVCHVENARWLVAEHRRCSPRSSFRVPTMLPLIDADDILDEIQEFLTGVREPAEPERVLATVLFTDVVGSTEKARELGDRRWRDLLDRHNEIVRRDLERFRGREVDTAGDGFFATFDGPARAIRCARSIVADVQSVGLEVRAGLHTGECELAGDQVRGIAVHTGARVASLAGAGEVLVSSTVRDLVAGSGIEFAERGVQSLKGIPGEWRLYAVA